MSKLPDCPLWWTMIAWWKTYSHWSKRHDVNIYIIFSCTYNLVNVTL
uniref:Uncharacterized protein n=1 Tax=Arundo donax TaxID=35708 RepID=A0A0A8ZJQ3_ARUDO